MIFSLSSFSFPSLCSPLSPLFSIDGLSSLLILETGLGLPVGNRLSGMVVDGVVAWWLETGLDLSISAWVCQSRRGGLSILACVCCLQLGGVVVVAGFWWLQLGGVVVVTGEEKRRRKEK